MSLRIETATLTLDTRGHTDIHDLTPGIREALRESGLRDGTVTVFVPGSTAGVSTIEFEPGLKKDLPEMFQRIAPENQDYHHHATWGDHNGAAHCRAPLIGPSLVVPFSEGELILGTWQQVVLFDFDDGPRTRRVILQFMGA